MNLLLLLFFISLASCNAYNNMFWSICKAVVATMIADFQYISVKPIRNVSNTDVSLIIFKGSHIDPHNYINISKIIQKVGEKKGLNIDIKIPYRPYCINSDINIANPAFILGHSSGTYDFLSWYNVSKYNGLIQMGSVLNSNAKLPWKSRKLETFPIPVLTMIGQKDGYLRHTYCLDEQYQQNETEKYRTKPIIIIKDITHLHISNTSSSNIAKLIGLCDLESNIDVKIAWNMLALCIVDFIILNMNLKSSDLSLKRMKYLQNKTQNLLSYYSKFDNTNNLKSLLGIIHFFLNNSIIKCDVLFLNYFDFLMSKPTDTTLYFYKEKRTIFSKMYFTPLWVKTKYKLYISAKQLNKQLFNLITNNLKGTSKFEIVFRDDKICATTLEWMLTSVSIEKKNNIIYIQSPVFITNKNTIIYKNFYYFKILSPSQIIELINIDLQDTI